MASLGLVQLQRYRSFCKKESKLVYDDEGLNDRNIDPLKHFGEGFTSNCHLYLVRLVGRNERYRNQVIKQMAEKGISTNVHFKPLPMHTAYQNLGFDIKDYPNAFNMYKNEITLPLHTLLTDEEVGYVINSFRQVLSEA